MQQIYANGTYVKKGAPLFQLDPRTFQASVDQAKGVLQQANRDLARAQAQQGKTQLDVARYTPLAQQGAISKQELDDAVQNNLSALAQVESAKASVASAEAELENSKLNLGFSTIVARTDGVAGIANAQVGDFISPQSANPLTTISIINPILANSRSGLRPALVCAQRCRLYRMVTSGLVIVQLYLALGGGWNLTDSDWQKHTVTPPTTANPSTPHP